MGYEPYRNDNRNDWGVSDRTSSRRSGYGYGYDPDRDRSRSSAREYYAAHPEEHDRYGARGGRDYDDRYTSGSRGYRNQYDEGRSGRGRERGPEGYRHDDRGFFDRAGDEVRSWFGDDEAERRREADARYDARYGNDGRDDDYHGWRRRQIEDLDRDYHEYRRENQTRFENEFGAWRTERQGQRSSLARVTEHMEVVGSDSAHVGTVDKVRGDRIVLTKSDPDAGGHHHSIPSRWIESVDDKVTIRKTADEAKAAWRDEDRSGAMFGERDRGDNRGSHYLNRGFSGTY